MKDGYAGSAGKAVGCNYIYNENPTMNLDLNIERSTKSLLSTQKDEVL
jgi:hypothetical protein